MSQGGSNGTVFIVDTIYVSFPSFCQARIEGSAGEGDSARPHGLLSAGEGF